MRSTLAACFLALITALPSVSAQTVGVSQPSKLAKRTIRDTALVNALNNSELMARHEFPRGAGLVVRVFGVPGESGSAKDGESDRVTSWLYFAVSEYGEMPEQRVYRLGPVYDPKVDSLVFRDSVPTAFISYGLRASRHKARVTVTLEALNISAPVTR